MSSYEPVVNKKEKVEVTKVYGLGFKTDRQKIAETFDFADATGSDPKVDEFLHITVHNLNRDWYKYIGTTAPPEACNIIVLEDGSDKEALAVLNVEPIDKTILRAKEYILVGPQVWELCQW